MAAATKTKIEGPRTTVRHGITGALVTTGVVTGEDDHFLVLVSADGTERQIDKTTVRMRVEVIR